MTNVHEITREFEKELCRYTSAPFAICVDNASNALFLALTYDNIKGKKISIPSNTYPSVPCEIIHAGGIVDFYASGSILHGCYPLQGSKVWDAALEFNANMYLPDTYMCISFTGPHKHLKLGKGGAILTDNEDAYKWFKKARFSGRSECSYHEDDFDNDPVIGWNMYMPPETAARGLLLIQGFYNLDGTKKKTEDLAIKYPDLSKFKCYQSQ